MSCINKKSINNNIDSLCIISTGSNNKSKKILQAEMLRNRKSISYKNSNTKNIIYTIIYGSYDDNVYLSENVGSTTYRIYWEQVYNSRILNSVKNKLDNYYKLAYPPDPLLYHTPFIYINFNNDFYKNSNYNILVYSTITYSESLYDYSYNVFFKEKTKLSTIKIKNDVIEFFQPIDNNTQNISFINDKNVNLVLSINNCIDLSYSYLGNVIYSKQFSINGNLYYGGFINHNNIITIWDNFFEDKLGNHFNKTIYGDILIYLDKNVIDYNSENLNINLTTTTNDELRIIGKISPSNNLLIINSGFLSINFPRYKQITVNIGNKIDISCSEIGFLGQYDNFDLNNPKRKFYINTQYQNSNITTDKWIEYLS